MRLRGPPLMLVLLLVVLGAMMLDSFMPGQVLFSNDGPLGRLVSQCHRMPEAFKGVWQDLNGIGFREGGALPNITSGLRLLLGPLAFSKFYVPITLLILGAGAFCFFQRLGLTPLACVLGGLAAALNSCFFSTACWGLGSLAITVGMTFFALAALAASGGALGWLQVALAGLAVGLGVAEGADIGAIFSLYVALFGVFQAAVNPGSRLKNLAVGGVRVGVVALFAACVAAQALVVLFTTQVEAVDPGQTVAGQHESRWDWATKWSLPKREALGLFIPGLFGYRMDAADGAAYWGAAGRDPAWDRYLASGKQGAPPAGFIRYSGGGAYAGELVILLAVWAGLQSLRRGNTVFLLNQRRWLWFWLIVGVSALLFAFGRYAPFYRVLYHLPYFSTIRNPAKFLHIFSFSLVILFAYGVDGLARFCLRPARPGEVRPPGDLKTWWSKASRFEKNWIYGMALVLALGLVGWGLYATHADGLETYLEGVLFQPEMARLIADFSVRQVGWFLLFFGLAVGLLLFVFGGRFAGPRAKAGGLLLGCLLLLDLCRANIPWVRYWDYRDKYASNAVLDLLRTNATQQRVTLFPGRMPPPYQQLQDVFRIEWLQHLFPYYNIQSLDISQMPRTPLDIERFEAALQVAPSAEDAYKLGRRWELTNTRYLICPAEALELLNRDVDPAKKRFRLLTRFELVPKAGLSFARTEADLTTEMAPEGTYAVLAFDGALPRTVLYTNWQIITNDETTLATLGSPAFHPQETVLVAGDLPAPANTAPAPAQSGSVTLTSYAPKDMVFRVKPVAPSVMLLNDRFDPNWSVQVDGHATKLLRCNYLMRGVYLGPGEHEVEFRFQPPVGPFYLSLAAIGVGLVLLGVVTACSRRAAPQVNAAASNPVQAPSKRKPRLPTAALRPDSR